MSRFRTMLLAAAASWILLGPSTAAAQVVVHDFSSDPTQPHGGDPVFSIRGPAAAHFLYEGTSPVRFAGDIKGSVSVTYDSLEPTTRLFTTFPGGFTEQDDFIFGAVLTIRPAGFAPDPFGFHPIAFSVFNSTTTGDERTGSLADFRADTFDTLEMAYFPNVSPLFGGPFLSPAVFGTAVSDDAFASFAFSSAAFELQPGVTYLLLMEHSAAARTLAAHVFAVRADGRAISLPDGQAVVDLSGVTAFAVDSLGISAYHDGFNVFASSGRSLLATVDYDLIFSGPVQDGRVAGDLAKALKRFARRAGRLEPSDPAAE